MSLKMKLNKEELKNKIYGCWIGKNIGGTIGTPYEGAQQLNDISGFASEKGEPLPNDDLDLQLVWLRAMEEVGPKNLSANVLADYWLSYITPDWNEYGIGKSNLRMGLLPPASGEFNNIWKHSNGAWIRSEIWACLAPGIPNLAVKYAIMDAQIDHGMGEGTWAEIFTAALESLAFFENDVRKLIETALTFIPKDCRVARSVNIVLKAYDDKLDWKKAREMVLEDSADLGWFQAPGNIAFTVLGLIYGEGDFKKSIILAVNCGDDTDCTGATVGALLGIVYGESNLPQDWKEYIGDSIRTVCVNANYRLQVAQTCSQLTDKVMYTLVDVLRAHDIDFEYADGENEIEEVLKADILPDVSKDFFRRSPYSFEVPSLIHSDTFVEYEKAPQVKAGDDFKVKITIKNKRWNPMHCEYTVSLPEGWSADYSSTGYVYHKGLLTKGENSWEMTIHVGECVLPKNNIQIMIEPKDRVMPIMVPIVLMG